MSSQPADPYKALGVGLDADTAAIKTAYRKLVLKCHPDKVQDPALKATKQDEFQRVQEAYEILSDEAKRREYDESTKLKRLRDELSRGLGRSAASPRSSPKSYNEPHIRTAEPPPSFKPGPPPTSPYSPYGASHQFSNSWDRDIPFRANGTFDEGHRARRATSYEKPREESKEERRRQKDEDEPQMHEWVRDKERERARERDRERERERERDRKSRSDREKDDRKEKTRRENEKRDKERDRIRRQEKDEKVRMRKTTPYVEPYDDSEEDRHYSKHKAAAGMSAGSGSKHADSSRHDKSGRREESPRLELNPDKTSEKMKQAADYMVNTRRRGSKSAIPSHSEGVTYSANFPDPEQSWHVAGDSPRSRRLSHDDKKFRTRVDTVDGGVDGRKPAPEFTPPRLPKSYTSPVGTLHMSNSPAPRIPSLSRAATMDYTRHSVPPPAAPAAPSADSSRHHSKSERRRRGSFDAFDDEVRPRRSSTQPHVLYPDFNSGSPLPRASKSSHYRASEDTHYASFSGEGSRRPGFSKVKMSPDISSNTVYQAKRFSDDDVMYSAVHRSSSPYSSPHTSSYLHVKS